MSYNIGDLLELQEEFPLIEVQSCHYGMDNIIGAVHFKRGNKFIIKVIKTGPYLPRVSRKSGDLEYFELFLRKDNSIFFIKSTDADTIFRNITRERYDKLNQLSNVKGKISP